MGEKVEVHVRKASGLVRNISAWDALVYNILVMAPTAVYVYGVWALALFPGVNLPLTALIAIPVCTVIGLFYAIYSVSMPRSGGDYVWVSRVLHPALGFMITFFLFIVVLAVAGSYIPWFVEWGIAPLLQYLGYESVAATISTPVPMFVIGLVYFLICAVIISRGSKTTAYVLWIFFALTLIGFLTYAGTLLSLGAKKFAENFSSLSGMSYEGVIEAAAAQGYPQTFLISATMMGIIFTILNFLGFNMSVYIAGEVKEVKKSQFIAIIGAIVIFGIITWAVYQVTYFGMGAKFIAAISYLAAIGDPTYKLNHDPFFHFLFQYAVRNPVIYGIVVFGWSMMTLAAILTYIFTGVRLVFAWSFDRVLPVIFSKVDRRYNSPYVALILVVILTIIFEALWLFTPVLNYFVYIVTGWFIATSITAISGIILPFKRKDIFEISPSIVRAKIGNMPVVSILGAITLVISVWLAYAGAMPVISGPVDPIAIAFSFGVFGVGLVVYFVSSWYHKAKGIPLELSFKELPPE
ncbi:MAG: APC family permease [Candidatus Baldrarchaeia archaeon]